MRRQLRDLADDPLDAEVFRGREAHRIESVGEHHQRRVDRRCVGEFDAPARAPAAQPCHLAI